MDPFRKEYRELDEAEKALMDGVKNDAIVLFDRITGIKDGREKALAITKLEEAVMWAVKGITG